MVAVTSKGQRLVGQPAKRQMITNAENTLLAIKRLMGGRYDDPEVQRYKEQVAFEVVASDNGDAWVEMGGKSVSPAEVSSMVLQKMKQTVEQFVGEEVTQAVITVPAYFNDAQRQATRDAGCIAGLEVLRLVNEPTAAALAFGLDKAEGKTIAVYDLGGGTFDISILEVNSGVFQVKATNGDTHLGGVDFDQCVIAHIVEQFEQDYGIDLGQDRLAMQRIREAAEHVRIELSGVQRADINLPFIHVDDEGPKHLSQTLSRVELEELVGHLIERTLTPCETALRDAGLPVGSWLRPAVDEVVLVGGMTRMPKVQEAVARLFGRDPHRGVNPDEVVAMGAAIQGGLLSGAVHDLILLDVTPFSLGVRTKGGGFSPLIEKNSAIPCTISKTFTTARNWQSQVTVRVAQGEEGTFEKNTFLGKFILDGLPLALRGTPKIDITFSVDADGMVRVAAKDRESGQERSMQIEVSGGLSEAQIQTLASNAREHVLIEAQARHLSDGVGKAEGLVDRATQLVVEYGEILATDLMERIETSIAALCALVDAGDDLQAMNQQTDQLQGLYAEAVHQVGENKATAPSTSATPPDGHVQGGEPPAAESVGSAEPVEPPDTVIELSEDEVVADDGSRVAVPVDDAADEALEAELRANEQRVDEVLAGVHTAGICPTDGSSTSGEEGAQVAPEKAHALQQGPSFGTGQTGQTGQAAAAPVYVAEQRGHGGHSGVFTLVGLELTGTMMDGERGSLVNLEEGEANKAVADEVAVDEEEAEEEAWLAVAG